MVKRKKIHVNVLDIHLLLNAIVKSANYIGVESWLPFCLGKTDPSSFYQIYVNYLFNDSKWFMVVISNDRNDFHAVSTACKDIEKVIDLLDCCFFA